MWIAKLIGTNVEIKSEDMVEAYNMLSAFAPADSKISMRYQPK